MDGGRINIGTCSVGGAAFCLDRALQYASERRQFGQPISQFQAIQFKLADMATSVHASRLMVRWPCLTHLFCFRTVGYLECCKFKNYLMKCHWYCMGRRAAQSLDAGAESATMDAAMAKRFATDACFNVADDAVQVCKPPQQQNIQEVSPLHTPGANLQAHNCFLASAYLFVAMQSPILTDVCSRAGAGRLWIP